MQPAVPMPMAPPSSLRFSSALLFGIAGLTLLQVAIELVFVNTDLSVYRDAYTGDTGSGFASLASATIGIFFAAGVSILAILNGHGRKNARVVTLVLGGLFLVCGGFGTLSGGLHRPSRSAGDGALARALPATYGISVGVLDLLIVLTALAAMVLLALPPTNRFFDNRQLIAYAHPAMPQPHIGYPAPANATPNPFSASAWTLPAPEQSPHTGSIPAIDPWAEPKDERPAAPPR